MLGEYMMISEEELAPLLNLNKQKLLEVVIELGETDERNRFDIGKLWDFFHFVLTGNDSSEPIVGNKLSEAVVGIHLFQPDGDPYITCIESHELSDIIAAMKKFNLQEYFENFNPQEFLHIDFYPKGILNTPKNDLFKEIKMAFDGLLSFYEKAYAQNQHVIFSVL